MEKYISKDAIVAEIERLISIGKLQCQLSQENNDQLSCIGWSEHIVTCEKILSFLNTLEVKEVDLEKEVSAYMDNEMKFLSDEVGYDTLLTIAKHFFELGLNTQRSSIDFSNIDDTIKDMGIDPYSKESKLFKEAYFKALNKFIAQKGE